MDRFKTDAYIENRKLTASKKSIDTFSPLHWHEFYEIEYIIDGSGSYTVDGEKYSVGSGMLFLMTPANFHEVDANGCRIFNLMFSTSACDPALLSRCISYKAPSALYVPDCDRKLLESLLDELTKNSDDPEYSSCLLNALLHKILSYKDNVSKNSSPAALATLYLHGHFRENPSLSEVAAHIGYTPTYFSSIFKQEIGESFKSYLDRLRFDYAHNLILSSTLTITQICKESGFDDYPNFIRRFTARFGCSPDKIRKQKSSFKRQTLK